MGRSIDAIRNRLEPAAGHVDRRAVSEMAAGGEIEAHERVARLHQREEHALIGLAAGIGLDVGEAAVEQSAGALDRQTFRDVDELAAAVIAPARIAFGVFVGHHRALRLEHGARYDVFRGDEFDLVALTAELEFDRAGDFGIGAREVGGKERVRTDRCCGGGGLSGDVHGGGPSLNLEAALTRRMRGGQRRECGANKKGRLAAALGDMFLSVRSGGRGSDRTTA